ncbi:unnamed protein product [Lactuca virosa]|uniref:Transcriptional factor DELLA N-terminal domain-containing protein n=1 Tax=Lactuca virosa TaxID=75947 RepID=A0AAU9N1J2_9ASTR|nr:unnamed protein product [Lactuca virosa]
MKRDYPQHDYTFFNGCSSTSASTIAASASGFLDVIRKSKLWDKVEEQDVNIDELLAVLGYKVKSSDMVDGGQKIEHLEGVSGTDDELSQLAYDYVHYNHSDLSLWLKSIICELNPINQPYVIDDSFVNKTASITSMVVESSSLSIGASSSYNHNPIVLLDTPENEIRLVRTLMALLTCSYSDACSKAVKQDEKGWGRQWKHGGRVQWGGWSRPFVFLII